MNKILRKAKGITLIALVVTVIVLLILAAVSVNLISGSDGILNRAQQATDLTIRAQEREQIVLVYDTVYIDHYEIGGVPFKAFAMEFDRKYYPNKAERVRGVDAIPSGKEKNEVSLLEKIENVFVPNAYADEGSADGNYDSTYYATEFNYAEIEYNTGNVYYVALKYADGYKPGTVIDPTPDDGEDDKPTILVKDASFELTAKQEYNYIWSIWAGSNEEPQKSVYIEANYFLDYSEYASKSLVGKTDEQKKAIYMEGDKFQKQYELSDEAKNATDLKTYLKAAYDYDYDENSFFEFLYWKYWEDTIDKCLISSQRVYPKEYQEKISKEYTITCEPKTVEATFEPQVVKNEYGQKSAIFPITESDIYILKAYNTDEYNDNPESAEVLDEKEVEVQVIEDIESIKEIAEVGYFTYEYVGPYANYYGQTTSTNYEYISNLGIVGYSVTGFSDAGEEYFGKQSGTIVEIPSEITVGGKTFPVIAVAQGAFAKLDSDRHIASDQSGYEYPTTTVSDTNISKIKIPGSVKYLGSSSLGCVNNNYVDVEIAEGLEYVDEYAFGVGTGDYADNYASVGTIAIKLPNSLKYAKRLNSAYTNDVFSISPKKLILWDNGGSKSTDYTLGMNQVVVLFRGTLSDLNDKTSLFNGIFKAGDFAYGSCIYCVKDGKCAVQDIDKLVRRQYYSEAVDTSIWFEPDDMKAYIASAIEACEEQDTPFGFTASDAYNALQLKIQEATEKLK